MNFTTILSNADMKIKFLRILEYLCLLSEDYGNSPKDKDFSQRMLHASDKIKQSRKLLRFMFSLWNLKKIIGYQNKDKIIMQKYFYLASKACGILFYILETITVLFDIIELAPGVSQKLKKWRFFSWITGLIISNIYCFTYLIHSYGKEAHLKNVSINMLKPYEIIQIMNTLADERKDLLLNICCNFMDCFIGCHYSGIIENMLKTRVTNGILGVVGVICTILRIYTILRKHMRKAAAHGNGHEVFDGIYYGYD